MFVAAGGWLVFSQSRAEAQEVHIQPRTHLTGPATTGSAERLRVDSDLVLIPVVVTDQQDRSVTGLGREYFRLWDQKTEQTISHFTAEDTPVSIGLVFDCSRSMADKLTRSRAAVAEFIRTANPQDEFSLVRFSDRAELVQGFTNNLADIQNRMIFLQANGSTALLDAVVLSLNEMRHAKNQRKAMLIISDGGDNNSRYSIREMRDRLKEADVQIYSIGIMEPFGARLLSPEEDAGPGLLDDIARQTGGRLFVVDDLNELTRVAIKIGAALRNQYVLGYVPTGEMRDGKYHRVEVKLNPPKGLPPLRASFRSGYFAPAN